MEMPTALHSMIKHIITSLMVFALAWLMGCASVRADHGTVITAPTQITTAQVGDYTVVSGSLYGLPGSTGQGTHVTGNITVTGPALLQDLVVDGCIIIDRANRIELQRVWVQHCNNDGIQMISDPGKQQSCCAKLDHVMSINNAGSGLHLMHTADVFISMSEFENNSHYGVELTDSPTARIAQTDFGGNILGGLYADDHSWLTMLSNNQYGNNRGDDLTLFGHDTIVTGQEFIGPPGACAVLYTGHQNFGTNNYGPRQLCPR